MNVTIKRFDDSDWGECVVTPEPDDPTFYDESRLMYHVKKELNRQGYDLIKKRMWKDGHMVDDRQQYLRARKPTGDPDQDIYIYDAEWVIRDSAGAYRMNGEITYQVRFDVYEEADRDRTLA